MKLHTIKIRHCAPKDCKEFMVCYVLADNETKIMDYIDEKLLYGRWSERNEEDGMCDVYDKDYNKVGEETYREKMLRLRGEFNDEDADYSDAYYGITHYGWDEGKEITDSDAMTLLAMNLALDLR